LTSSAWEAIGLGTLAVRNYLKDLRDLEINDAEIAAAGVSTKGPMGRYGAVLFLEKEDPMRAIGGQGRYPWSVE